MDGDVRFNLDERWQRPREQQEVRDPAVKVERLVLPAPAERVEEAPPRPRAGCGSECRRTRSGSRESSWSPRAPRPALLDRLPRRTRTSPISLSVKPERRSPSTARANARRSSSPSATRYFRSGGSSTATRLPSALISRPTASATSSVSRYSRRFGGKLALPPRAPEEEVLVAFVPTPFTGTSPRPHASASASPRARRVDDDEPEFRPAGR